MRRNAAFIALLCLLPLQALAARTAAGPAPSAQAAALRAAGDLVPYAPAKALLEAYFTADEARPRAVWGPVAAYVKSRACRTAWLIERGELARIERLAAAAPQADAPPYEFSLTLEEDCPGKVTHAVFVSTPGGAPEAWLKWRSQFHGRKAEAHYAAALEGLKRAHAAGRPPTAELRFLAVNGELLLGSPEQALSAEGKLRPVFDLQAK